MIRTWMIRILSLLTGFYVGVLGAAVHRVHLNLADIAIPWAMVLAVLTTALLMAFLSRQRWLGELFAIGWIAAMVFCTGISNRGYLVELNAYGIAFLFFCFGALMTVLVRTPR